MFEEYNTAKQPLLGHEHDEEHHQRRAGGTAAAAAATAVTCKCASSLLFSLGPLISVPVGTSSRGKKKTTTECY
jgi:hypothetical protein